MPTANFFSELQLAEEFSFFFFSSRRRHTRYIGDWSSDVCSSDLVFVRRVRDVSARVPRLNVVDSLQVLEGGFEARSEERRVGKECRAGWAGDDEKDRDIRKVNKSNKVVSDGEMLREENAVPTDSR